MMERLKEDHLNARRLAEGITKIPGLSIDIERIKTNIIYFDLTSDRLKPAEFITQLGKKGIKLLGTGPSRFRVVTHYGISSEDVDATLLALNQVMEEA